MSYGKCPICGADGIKRERRMAGNDICKNGHTYPSADANKGNTKISKKKLVYVLKNLLDYANRNTCLHEETSREGVLWEVCNYCGMRWADDKGGKPDDVHDLPDVIEDAQNLLDEIEKG